MIDEGHQKRSRKEPFRGVINGLVGTHRRFTSPEATHTQRHITQTVAAVPWTDVSTAVRLAPDMRLSISREYCFLTVAY